MNILCNFSFFNKFRVGISDENLYLENVTIENTKFGNIAKFSIILDKADEKKNI